jgi:hypothetical protein
MKPVRQWGEQGSTIEEELSCRIITGFYNAALNGIASSVKFIGGSSKFLDVHFNKLNYTKELNNLKTYSIVRQLTNQSVGMSTEQTFVQGD